MFMSSTVSFTDILNPVCAKPGSEHLIASRVTWDSLKVAHAAACEKGLDVDCCAVILPGDESAVEDPAKSIVLLNRTIQDVKRLQAYRALPLIADVLACGASGGKKGWHKFMCRRRNRDVVLRATPRSYISSERCPVA